MSEQIGTLGGAGVVDDEIEIKRKFPFSLFDKKGPKKTYNIEDYPHLITLRPQEMYLFKPDYYRTSNKTYSCILSVFHKKGALDRFGPFWGLNLLPANLPKTSTAILFEQTVRKPDEWVASKQTSAEKVSEANAVEQARGGTNTTKTKAKRSMNDLAVISTELLNGAVYLHVHYRIQVTSPTLKELDFCVDLIQKQYTESFGSMTVMPYQGEQRKELSGILHNNSTKMGVGYYFTSTEYAGCYNLVTHGIEDPGGEYVGVMSGDINNSAVLFDINNFKRNIVVADAIYEEKYSRRVRRSDVWGSKIAQSALLNNGRVTHLILTPFDMDVVSPRFDGFTNRVNMATGDLNMFEFFGSHEDELSLFPRQIEKIKIMIEEISPPTENERTILRGSLGDALTQFYIDSRMWVANAGGNREKIRLCGIAHKEVPKLQMFVTNLEQKHKALMTEGRDKELIHAYAVLKSVFRSMLTSNGDLFNTTTNSVFDTANKARRVIYDFGSLIQRGGGIALAQTVNVINYALSELGQGDVVLIHGCDNITSEPVKEYLRHELEFLYSRGGRSCMIYNDVHNYMKDIGFNEAIRADYTIMSTMAPGDVDYYEKQFGIDLPNGLRKLVCDTHSTCNYLHRGFDNVIFTPDLYVGVDADRRSS
jgi:hypothetical protein